MFLVVTRNFPPEIGGMQHLMEGLSNALLNHELIDIHKSRTHDDATPLTVAKRYNYTKIITNLTSKIMDESPITNN